MNLTKHRNVQFCEKDELSKKIRSHLYIRHQNVMINGESRFYEVIKSKKAVTDTVPIATAFFILCHAKLTVLQFVTDLIDCIDSKGYRLLYMGLFFILIFYSYF